MHVIDKEARDICAEDICGVDSHILAAALEGPRVGIVIFDSNLRVTHTNARLRGILGIDGDVFFRQAPLNSLI